MGITSLANTDRMFRICNLKTGQFCEGKPSAVELVKEGAILTMVDEHGDTVQYLMDYHGRLYPIKEGKFDLEEDTWFIKAKVWAQVDRAPVSKWLDLQERVAFHRAYERW